MAKKKKFVLVAAVTVLGAASGALYFFGHVKPAYWVSSVALTVSTFRSALYWALKQANL